ncbi:hypothetical protein DFH94DRAFT_370168 [Russula ochroleuca]|uniref:Pre-mRNA-splicing factor CWC24 n=1 Tax=Russula ochroleuca TaxID=152965 RepID=A0A9P5MZG0_9AGAM|nr:hypothetical protein DFH94DRAFT_370168 [Russula ochroleuca]
MASEAVSVPFFKKKRARPTTTRQRTPSPPIADPASASSSKSQVVLPPRKAGGNLLTAGTKRTSSQRRTDGLEDDADEDMRDGPGINWTSTGGHLNKVLEILEGDEAEEMLAKRARKDPAPEDDVPYDGLYHGQKSYKSHIRKSQEVPKSMRTGPVRSNNSTIRTVTIVDYQPDVCKDYKETGFCGFGDTCKFLHDRGTYLAGWQLDKLADNPQKQAEDESDADSDDGIPFACLIGRHPFTDPIVTRCGHYFCSACAIKRFAKTPKCAACGAPTGGIFNRADKVITKMKKMEAEEQSPGEGEENVPTSAQIEGLDRSDPEHSDSDQED